MTSFYADSFRFFSHQPASMCAFLATTRPIFNSSIIPVLLSRSDLWTSIHAPRSLYCEESLLRVLQLSDTMQFTPSLTLREYQVDNEFLKDMFRTLITERRYFCRTLKHLRIATKGVLPIVCRHLTGLQTLDCAFAVINDADLKLVGRLTRLRELNLKVCLDPTDEGLAPLANLTCLEKLDLSRNRYVTGRCLAHLQNMTNLKELRLDGMAKLEDKGILQLPYLPSLIKLVITFNSQITDVGFEAVVKQKNLQTLEMTYCLGITLQGFSKLADLNDLVNLNLTRCSQVDDDWLSALAKFGASLRKLLLHDCENITDDGIVKVVSEMEELEHLDLWGCYDLTDRSLSAIAKLGSLEHLDIREVPQVTKMGILRLHGNPHLKSLLLGVDDPDCTNIGDDALYMLKFFPSLRELTLVGVPTISVYAVQILSELARLEKLTVMNNETLTGDHISRLVFSKSLRKVDIIFCEKITEECKRFFDGYKIHVEVTTRRRVRR